VRSVVGPAASHVGRTDRLSPGFREPVSASKYKIWKDFGEAPEGHILLQDHDNRVSFRNIRIRTFDPS
jgi:hypothetical protein